MRRTTEQWEALLDGTADGPWFANVRGFGRIENIGPISAGFSIGDGLDCDEDDAILAAAAPEAVAEVIRLRKAIAELEAEERATADDEFFPVHLRDLCRAFADDLARILEGDTDE